MPVLKNITDQTVNLSSLGIVLDPGAQVSVAGSLVDEDDETVLSDSYVVALSDGQALSFSKQIFELSAGAPNKKKNEIKEQS